MDASARIKHLQRTYQRTLAHWTQDLLLLRARGLTRPTWPVGQRTAAPTHDPFAPPAHKQAA